MGSGFAIDSVKNARYNRLLKVIRKARYNEMKDAVNKIKGKYHHFSDKSNLTIEEQNEYKIKIRKRIRIQKQRTFLLSSFTTIIIFALIILISKFLYNYLSSAF